MDVNATVLSWMVHIYLTNFCPQLVLLLFLSLSRYVKKLTSYKLTKTEKKEEDDTENEIQGIISNISGILPNMGKCSLKYENA